MKKIIPLGDRVLILPKSEGGETNSGIIIPDTIDKEKPMVGEVIAVGEGRVSDDGKVIPNKVKKGDIVIYSKYGPDEVEVGGKEYLIISESNILGIIK